MRRWLDAQAGGWFTTPMPDASKPHEHRVFYRYLSRQVAGLTLSTMTTRWSSPLLYNDPFDTPNNLSFTFPREAVPAIAMMLMQLIVDEPHRGTPKEASIAKAIEAARGARTAEQKSLALVGAATKAGMEADEYLRFTNAMWSTKLDVMRVFCVSEVFDDLLMWAHYAESHRGVVLGLRCMDGTATNLCAAKPVAYSHQLPVSEDEALDWVCRYFDGSMIKGMPEEKRRQVYDAMTLTKSDHWSYEKEWRCFGDEDYDCLKVRVKHKDDLVRSVPLQPEEVESVYIGCRMPPEDERDLQRLVQEKLPPETKVLRGRQSSITFGLEFS